MSDTIVKRLRLRAMRVRSEIPNQLSDYPNDYMIGSFDHGFLRIHDQLAALRKKSVL